MANDPKEKKVPIRRCVGCGEHFPKSTMARVLRTPEGEIVLDLTGKKSGRGAYICPSAACLKKARKRLEFNLECNIPDELFQNLEIEIERNSL